MTDAEKEEGIVTAMLQRFESQVLPRAMDIQAKLARGERLADFDLQFLEDIMEEAEGTKPYVDRHPELQELYTRTVSLYHEIASQATANETGI
jgi:hypothetical protein